ncbi:MAG: AAA family ATPase [Ignavibacteriae bacterium]|nr:AAA family ATPase [Ignavibacteriota bacterium]
MWKNIIGQDRVINILSNMYASGRIPHSLIFYGKEGTGKDAAAIEIAKLVNCDNPVNVGTSLKEACDVCTSCRQIATLNSVYFKFITALPTGKKESNEEDSPVSLLNNEDRESYHTELKRKAANPYYKISLQKANNIRIDSIRQIRKDIFLTAGRGKTKVFLISNADLMNPQSSNAFLKILEEPPGRCLIILTTARVNSLLPTITGRCQKIRFDSIKKKELTDYLMKHFETLSKEETALYAGVAEGSISKCMNIMNSYFLELRDSVLGILRAVVTKQYFQASVIINTITSAKDKEKVRLFLFLMILWFRDITCISNDNEEIIINKDKIDNINKFHQKYRSESFEIINLLEDLIKELDMNVNTELMLHTLFYKLTGLIRISR